MARSELTTIPVAPINATFAMVSECYRWKQKRRCTVQYSIKIPLYVQCVKTQGLWLAEITFPKARWNDVG